MPSIFLEKIDLPPPKMLIFDLFFPTVILPGREVQSVTIMTADQGVASLIPGWSHTFVEIYHEIISTVILFHLPIQEGLLSVTSKVHVCAQSTG